MDGRQCWIESLSLSNFRNYNHLRLDLDFRPVVLTGHNGAGKTNLVEAISLLAPGRGLRRSSSQDLARFSGQGDWAVSALVHGNEGEVRIGTGADPVEGFEKKRRKIKIDGEFVGSSVRLSDYLQIIWLTPAMDGLFIGPASDRRRFLDRLIAVFNPDMRRQINQFERAMRQRNKLLEDMAAPESHYAGLEMQMAEIGVAIAAGRVEAIERLSAVIAKDVKEAGSGESPFPSATLSLEGVLEEKLGHMAALDAEDFYKDLLARNRTRDRLAKRTLEGPHRTDLVVGHQPKQMPARYCSTGEQKALLTGLILAHAKLVKEMAGGFSPLLLLDEIAAHFDEVRREALFREILEIGAQAWMTGTDREIFDFFGEKAQIFELKEAEILA